MEPLKTLSMRRIHKRIQDLRAMRHAHSWSSASTLSYADQELPPSPTPTFSAPTHQSVPTRKSEVTIADEYPVVKFLRQFNDTNGNLAAHITSFLPSLHFAPGDPEESSSFAVHAINISREIQTMLVLLDAVLATQVLQQSKPDGLQSVYESRTLLHQVTSAFVRATIDSSSTKAELVRAASSVLCTTSECVGATKLLLDKHDTMIRIKYDTMKLKDTTHELTQLRRKRRTLVPSKEDTTMSSGPMSEMVALISNDPFPPSPLLVRPGSDLSVSAQTSSAPSSSNPSRCSTPGTIITSWGYSTDFTRPISSLDIPRGNTIFDSDAAPECGTQPLPKLRTRASFSSVLRSPLSKSRFVAR